MNERHEEIQTRWPTLLPSPETLAEYNGIVPGTADRILSMTERTVTSKIEVASKIADAEIQAAKTNLSVTIGLTLLAFVASATFFALRSQVAGMAFASFLMILLVKSFLVGPR